MSEVEFDVGMCAGHAGFGVTPGKRTPDGEYEWTFNDVIVRAAIAKLQANGVRVLRTDDPTGRRDVPLEERTDKANKAKVKIYVSVHHNANTGKWGTWTGIETYTYLGSQPKSEDLAEELHDRMVKVYDLRDRGLKKKNLHIVRETNMPAVLLEGGYMDSTIDIKKLRDNALLKRAGESLAEGIMEYLGVTPKAPTPAPSNPAPSKPKAPVEYFRVRKDWKDVDSQLGAFRDKLGAVELAKDHPGYEVYDNDGNVVYPAPVAPAKPATPNTGLFRVRKTWTDAGSQLGAFKDKEGAIDLAKKHSGYEVYDENGKVIYPVSAPAPVAPAKPTAPAKKTSGVTTADALNVRAGVGVEHKVVATLKEGTKISILDTKEGWHKILVDGEDHAWVSGKYIKNGVIVNCSRLNARAGAGANHRVVDVVDAGKKFAVVGTENGWVKIVISPAEYGWVSGKYVK